MTVSIRSGRLRDLVEIRNPVRTLNEHGEEKLNYVTVETAWVSVEPIRAREYIEARHLQPELETVIVLRPTDNVRSDSQIVVLDKGIERVYELIGPPINVENRNKRMELLCRRATRES